MLQRDYSNNDYTNIRNRNNLNLLNMADITSKFISNIPNDIRRLSVITDKLSNLSVISGNTYFYNRGRDFKVVENKDVDFDPILNSLKLKPVLSYKLEPKEGGNKIITDKSIRIFNRDKTKLMSLDDMLIRKTTINIRTEENVYKYTLALTFSELTQYNNIKLKLNNETESYPHITEVYYINSKREKKSIKILNNNLYDLDLDLFKNSSNIYEIDTEIVTADNIYIVFEDSLNELIIDSLEVNYMKYPDTGYIVLEAIQSDKAILKVGIESQGNTESIKYEISHNRSDWYPLDISNTYSLENKNKVVSYNTINLESIKTAVDVKTLFLRATLQSITETFTPNAKINKSVHTSPTIDTKGVKYTTFSLYENSTSNFYGELSTQNRFNFEDLYDNGEYLLIDNKYYIKGFAETDISKIHQSKYVYAPVSLKTKELKASGDILIYDNIDVSTKEVYSAIIEPIQKNLVDTRDIRFVLPLKDDKHNSLYFISQNDKEIMINLSTGYINTVLDVLFTVEEDGNVYLLDSFKNKVERLTPFKYDDIALVSLLDSSLFKGMENLSRLFPLVPLKQYELGLLDNKVYSINTDREVQGFHLSLKKLYTEDTISNKNKNYSTILSTDDYNRSHTEHSETLTKYKKQHKLLKAGVVKGSLHLGTKLYEIPFINGYTEFLEYFSKEYTIDLGSTFTDFEYRLELDEDKVLDRSLSYSFPEEVFEALSVIIAKDNGKYYIVCKSVNPLTNLKIIVNYTYENTNAKYLYSVDYDKGVLYFSESLDDEYAIQYKSDNIVTTGKKAKQLEEEAYTDVSNTINIRNPKDNTSIFFLYKNTVEEHRSVTPIVQDLKVNYIIKDALSL